MPAIMIHQFTGPYDTLLGLIENKELSISDIALAEVTEQFLSYIDQIEEERPTEVADFLTTAAKLLLLKSSLLLPTFQYIEEDELSLTKQLKRYEQFRQGAVVLEQYWESDVQLGIHNEIYTREIEFSWPEGLSTDGLRDMMKKLVQQHTPPKPLPQTAIDKTVSLKEIITRLRQSLIKGTKTSFWQYADKRSKTSVIVHFLALLELTKLGTVQAEQSTEFTDITIEPT